MALTHGSDVPAGQPKSRGTSASPHAQTRTILWIRLVRDASGHIPEADGLPRLLRIDPQDHHAAAAGGWALASRGLFCRSHPLAQQIARDRNALKRAMRATLHAAKPDEGGNGAHGGAAQGRLKFNLASSGALPSQQRGQALDTGRRCTRQRGFMDGASTQRTVNLEPIHLDALADSSESERLLSPGVTPERWQQRRSPEVRRESRAVRQSREQKVSASRWLAQADA